MLVVCFVVAFWFDGFVECCFTGVWGFTLFGCATGTFVVGVLGFDCLTQGCCLLFIA